MKNSVYRIWIWEKKNNLYVQLYLSLQPRYHLQPRYPSLNPVKSTFLLIIFLSLWKSNLMFVEPSLKFSD